MRVPETSYGRAPAGGFESAHGRALSLWTLVVGDRSRGKETMQNQTLANF